MSVHLAQPLLGLQDTIHFQTGLSSFGITSVTVFLADANKQEGLLLKYYIRLGGKG